MYYTVITNERSNMDFCLNTVIYSVYYIIFIYILFYKLSHFSADIKKQRNSRQISYI
jgi:hypothetical protein